MGNVQETKALLAKQRRSYLIGIGVISAVAIGFLAATIVLGVRLSTKNCDKFYPAAQVKYHVWSHHDAVLAPKHGVELKVPENVTMFSVMEHAQRESQQRFGFTFTQLPFGKYVTSIGGVEEDLVEQRYWILYKLNAEPQAGRPPTEEMALELGIDDLRVKDGEIYLFWLTKFGSHTRDQRILDLSRPSSIVSN